MTRLRCPDCDSVLADVGCSFCALRNFCHVLGLPEPTGEVLLDETRGWKLDAAWPEWKVAIEVDGGTWINGRHNRGAGMERDMEKGRAAVRLGWAVLHYTPQQVTELEWVPELTAVLQARGWAAPRVEEGR